MFSSETVSRKEKIHIMLSFLNKIFSSSEINLIEFVDETKIIINIPLNAKKYLKDLSKKKWNSEKDIDYTFSESVSVNDSVSFWANERYAPEVKFFSSSNGEGFISVVNSKILFKIFWIIKSSEWPAWLLSGGTVIEKNKNRIKVEFKFNIKQYREKQDFDFKALKVLLDKKYKPKSTWSLIFQVSRKLTKRDLDKLSIAVDYDDEQLRRYIYFDSLSIIDFKLLVGVEDLFVRYFSSDNHRYKQKQLIRAIKSNVDLITSSKKMKFHPTLHRDCNAEEFMYELTFTPM